MRLSTALSLGAWLALTALGPAPAPVVAQPIDPFYTALYEDGVRSYRASDYASASEELRIAAFGLLDRPEQLTRALAYLALSENALGNVSGFREAHRRLSEVEERFGTVSGGALRLTVRAALDEAVRRHQPEGALPADAEMIAAAEALAREAEEAAEERAKVCISWDGSDECQPSDQLETTIADADRSSGEEPSQLEPAIAEPDPASAEEPLHAGRPGPDELTVFSRLDATANGKNSARKLRQALEEALAMADRFPDWRELHQVTGLLAGRSGDYPTAIVHYDRAGSLEDSPIDLYYLAIALYESGRPQEANAKLRQALPQLERSREVRKNAKKILSDGGLQ